jgi:CBS domain containing-hemolysin-like protein
LICVFASAFFSAFETAITSITEVRARQLIEERHPGRRLLRLWVRVPNRVLTTILVGNNLVNMLAAGLSARVADSFFRESYSMEPGSSTALAVAVGGITLFILIFGEIFPKTFAKHNAEGLMKFSTALEFFYWLTIPLTIGFVWLARGVAHLLGARISKDGPLVRIEDIEHMVRMGAENESLDEDKIRYLSGVLELSETDAREIMVPRTEMSAIDCSADLATIVAHAKEDLFSRYPVYRDQLDEIIGVVYLKDLLNVLASEENEAFDLESLVRPPVFVPETRNVGALLKDFRELKVHMAIVVDEFGGTAGLVTLEDVIEEIVGEIYDEYDDEDDNPIQRLDDGSYLLDGTTLLRDVEQVLDIEFTDDHDYDSIAGYVVHEAGEVPGTGFSCDYAGYRFAVIEADERRVLLVSVNRLDDEELSEVREA